MKAKRERRDKNTGSVYFENSSGRWIAQVLDGHTAKGRCRYRRAKRLTKADAVIALNELSAKVTLGIPIPDGNSRTLASWLKTWLENYVKDGSASQTYRFYKSLVDNHLAPGLGSHNVRKVDPNMISNFYKAKLKGGSTVQVVHAMHRTLRAAYSRAVKIGLCTDNPVKKVDSPKVEKGKPRFLTVEQANELRNELKGSPVEHLVLFGLATGTRIGEATGLTWEQVDFKENKIRIDRQLQREDRKLTLKKTKNENSNREISLRGEVLAVIQAAQKWQEAHPFDNPLNLVFLNIEGRPFDPKYVNTHLKVALKAAKIGEASFHSLRHTAATFMLMSGIPLHTVGKWLGHAQIALTSNLYGHVLSAELEEAGLKLQAMYIPQPVAPPVKRGRTRRMTH